MNRTLPNYFNLLLCKKLSCFFLCAILAQFAFIQSANATVIFSGSGNNPEVSANASGTASFSIAGDTLTVVLKNTTSPRTASQGNSMTGVVFDIDSASPRLHWQARP